MHDVSGDDKIEWLEFCEQYILSKVTNVKFDNAEYKTKVAFDFKKWEERKRVEWRGKEKK